MILDVFTQFRKAGDDIREAINEAYPENSLDANKAFRSLSRVEGIVDTLESTLESRISLAAVNKKEKEEEEQHSLRRRIDADWKPSDAWEPAAAVDSSEDEPRPETDPILSVDYFHFLSEFVKANKNSLDFYKKQGNNTAHATLQRVQAMNQMLTAFLNSINRKRD